MPRKKRPANEGVQLELEKLSTVLLDGDIPDWSALDTYPLGELIALLGPLDAGVMIRSSERGASRSIGVFVGGQSQWTTCRDQRELLALLEAAQTTLEALLGAQRSGTPVAPTKRAAKRS